MLEDVRLPSGWFDRGFFLYVEDLDLGWRSRLAGWDARYLPAATVFHDAHASTGQRGWNFIVAQCAKNRLRTLMKNGSGRLLLSTLRPTLFDLRRMRSLGGPSALATTLRGAVTALRERPAVGRLIRVPRTSLERRWLERDPSDPRG
jgi:GT2 family glycosyltransferase